MAASLSLWGDKHQLRRATYVRADAPMTIPATSKRVSSASVLVWAHFGTWISPSKFPPMSFLKAMCALVQLAFQSFSTGKVLDLRSKSSQALQMLKNGALLWA